jgi:predicted Zn finger-like uncharacterized protein
LPIEAFIVNINCVRCGQSFSITAEQLGTRGKCPHCSQTILLPKSERVYRQGRGKGGPSSFRGQSVCGIASVLVHVLVFTLLMLIPWSRAQRPVESEGTSVDIAVIPREALEKGSPQWDWSSLNQTQSVATRSMPDELLPGADLGDLPTARIASPMESAAQGIADASEFNRLSSVDGSLGCSTSALEEESSATSSRRS